MTFVSGALFPIAVLPDWLQTIGEAMPTWFAFEGLRDALFEGGGWADDARRSRSSSRSLRCRRSFWLLAASLAHAKRQGSLGQY